MRMCRLCAFERNDDDAERCRQCGADMAPAEEEEADLGEDSAWFHYLQVPGIGTIELVPGRALRMGKDPRNELVIPKASQDQLATLFWTDDYDEATIKEMGAPEGVKVDGVRITGTRTLKGGEELLVGPLRVSYLRRAKPIKGAIDAARLTPKGPGARQGIAAPAPQAATGARSAPGVRGGRGGVVAANPAGVCLALEKMKASGTLRVTSPRGRGFVTVVQGSPRHAAFGGLAGPSALLAILALPQGRCQMVPGVPVKGKGPKLEGSFSQVIATRKAKVDAQRGPKTGIKAPPRLNPAPRPPGSSTLRPGAPTPRPGSSTLRPGAPTPRPGGPRPGVVAPPRQGQPTPAPRPGQPTPRPGQRPPGPPSPPQRPQPPRR